MKPLALATFILVLSLPARAAESPAKADVEAVNACFALVKENQKKIGQQKEEAPGAAGRLAAAVREAPLATESCIGVV